MKGEGNDGTEPLSRRLTLVSPKSRAQEVRRTILEMGLFDPHRSIGKDRDHIYFPVLTERDDECLLSSMGLRSKEVTISQDVERTPSRRPSPSPFDLILSELTGMIPEEDLEKLPGRWEMLGDCLILRVPGPLRGYLKEIAGTYMNVLGARYVLGSGRISGEFREPSMEIIIPPGDGNWEVAHTENRIRYTFDPRKVMFSSGNVDVRHRSPGLIRSYPIRELFGPPDKRGEVVLDMFAGIGYFSLPIAKYSDVGQVISCEKNPVSYGYLLRNIKDNNLQDRVEPVHGDNRSLEGIGGVDRIIMGYVGGTVGFLPRALGYLKERGGMVHIHDTISVRAGRDDLMERIRSISNEEGFLPVLRGSRRVKSFAPGVVHITLDIQYLPKG